MSPPPRLWHRPAVYRSAIGLYVFVVLAVAGVTFAVNSVDVQGSLYLRGQPDLEHHRIHGTRGVFHYAPTGEMLVPETMHWSLFGADGDGPYELQFIDGHPHDSWPNPTFRLPDDLPHGDYLLHVEATHRQVSELAAEVPVTVDARPEPAATLSELRWPRAVVRDDRRRRDDTVEFVDFAGDLEEAAQIEGKTDEEAEPVDDDENPGLRLAVVPADGEMVRGMAQSIYLRTYQPETGLPIPSTIELEVEDGIIEGALETSFRTDRLGIAELEIKPATSITLSVLVEPAPPPVFDPQDAGDDPVEPLQRKEFELNLPAVATQYSLKAASPVFTPGDTVDAIADSVLTDGYFMVDLYDFEGDRLLDAASLMMTDGRSGVRFDAPPSEETSPLLRLQTYQSIYGTTHGWDNTYVLLLDDDTEEDLRGATEDLYLWIAQSSDNPHYRAIADGDWLDDMSAPQLRRMLRVGLAEVPRTFEMAPVLLNTREDDRRALDAWRADVQDDLRLMMGLLVLIGVVVVLYFVVVGIRRNMEEAAVLRQFELETSDPPDEVQLRAERIERFTVILQGVIVFCTLLVFALGILIMVSYL